MTRRQNNTARCESMRAVFFFQLFFLLTVGRWARANCKAGSLAQSPDLLPAKGKIMEIIVDDRFDQFAILDQQPWRELWRGMAVATNDGANRLDHLASAAACRDIAPRARL